MIPNLEQLRKNYEQFDDKKLLRIASEEAARLRPDALELLKQEIARRGLTTDAAKADILTKEVNAEELAGHVETLRNLPCPICGSTGEKLNATIVSNVMSFIVFTHQSKEVKIACPRCLNKQNNNAMVKTALLGWWGIPFGLIRTPAALMFNARQKAQNDLPEANDLFKSFVYGRLGRIEVNKNNPEGLQDIITHIR
ncbi:hypothetical protein [Mucilaginibacter sp.]|uniref:hypothetical protein n=1 Tax=Mucilaginibacter sp. TaxID=1882438 RepID=UPI0025E7B0D8|nr:hypothetical protein [Mucilaginibacter sp.]